jgi:hypothetical protein
MITPPQLRLFRHMLANPWLLRTTSDRDLKQVCEWAKAGLAIDPLVHRSGEQAKELETEEVR